MNKTNKQNKNVITEETIKNDLIREWFTYIVESIAEEEKTPEELTKAYIKKVENYRGVDFFECKKIVDDFIKEVEKSK